jgi:hypothetical protein
MADELCIGKILKGSDYSLIEALSWNVFGGTEESHEKAQSGWPVTRTRFELSSV